MMEVTIKDVVGAVGILSAMFACYKIATEVMFNKIKQSKDELELTKVLVEACKEDAHPLFIEKAFEATFRKLLTAEEIKHLINWPNPSEALTKYYLAKGYIEFDKNTTKVRYTKRWTSKIKRFVAIGALGLVYFFFALFALTPLFFAKEIIHDVTGLITFGFMALGFGIVAVTCAREVARMRTADSVMKKLDDRK